jgi:hypothetical protein
MVGVYMDDDEAASGSAQYPLDPFVSHRRGNQKFIRVIDVTGELNPGRSASVLSHSDIQTSLKSMIRHFMMVAIFMK